TYKDIAKGNIRRPAEDPSPPLKDQSSEDSLNNESTNQDQAFHALPTSTFELKEALEPDNESPKEAIYSYIHFRVNARATPDSDSEEICFDPGASRSLIGRDFLKKLDHTIEDRNSKVKGIGDKLLKLNQWATFTIYLLGL
ncbi:hypothetical protein MMYC01_210344, partial [Madurella mycetomatis]